MALRGLKDILCCAVLDGLTGVHDHDLLAGLGHNTQIVGDEDHGGVQPLLQLIDQAQHLGLNGHIQCGGGFVGKDQLRLAGQRNGNDNALLHAAGKLMGILHLALCRDAHQLHHFVHTGFQLSSALLRMVDLQHLHDLSPHGHHRVQGRHRILEDHGYYTAAHGTDLFLGSIQHIHTVQLDGAVGHKTDAFRQKLDDAQGCGGLTGTGLTHQTQRLAVVQIQVQTIDGVDGGNFGIIFNAQVFDFQQLVAHFRPPLSHSWCALRAWSFCRCPMCRAASGRGHRAERRRTY